MGMSERDMAHVFERLRSGVVPERGLETFAVGIDKQRAEIYRLMRRRLSCGCAAMYAGSPSMAFDKFAMLQTATAGYSGSSLGHPSSLIPNAAWLGCSHSTTVFSI